MSFFDRVLDVAKSMGVKNFSYYKKWALDHLKKQLNEENQVTKAIEYCEDYLEKAYGVGTIRTWKGKKYIKGPDKKWRRYFEKNGRGTARAISNIMKEINSLENGDIEGLYAIIQKNAGRFRDENGNVLPEVQQIHDLVEKKQAGSENTESKLKAAKEDLARKTKAKAEARDKYGLDSKEFKDAEKEENKAADKRNALMKEREKESANKRHEMWNKKEATKNEKPKLTATQRYEMGIRDEKYEQARKDAEMRNQNEKVEPMAADEVKKIHDKIEENRKKGKKVTPYEAKKQIENEELMNKVKQINDKAKEDIKIENQKKLIDLTKKHQDNLKKIAELSSKKNQEMNKRAEDFYKEHGKIAGKEDLGTSTYDKEIEDLLVEDAKVQKLGETISKNMEIKHPDIEETEQEKHDNRSNAMLGNKNAYKGGPKEVAKYINGKTTDIEERNKMLSAAFGERYGTDPEYKYAQTAIGDLLKNVRREIPHTEKWYKAVNDYNDAAEMYKMVIGDSGIDYYNKDVQKEIMKPNHKPEIIAELEKNKGKLPTKISYKIKRTYNPEGSYKGIVFSAKYGDMNIQEEFASYSDLKDFCKNLGDFYLPKESTIDNFGGNYDGGENDIKPKDWSKEERVNTSKNPEPEKAKEEPKPEKTKEEPKIEKKDGKKSLRTLYEEFLNKNDGKNAEKVLSKVEYLGGEYQSRKKWIDKGYKEGTLYYDKEWKRVGTSGGTEIYTGSDNFESRTIRRYVIFLTDYAWNYEKDKERGKSYDIFNGKPKWEKGNNIIPLKAIDDVSKFGYVGRDTQKERLDYNWKIDVRKPNPVYLANVKLNGGFIFDPFNCHKESSFDTMRPFIVKYGGKGGQEHHFSIDELLTGSAIRKLNNYNEPKRFGSKEIYEQSQKDIAKAIKFIKQFAVQYEGKSLSYFATDLKNKLESEVKKSFSERITEIMQKSGPAEPKHDLEYFKKWALSVLDKQKEEPGEEDGPSEETIVKALAYTEMIAKAGYPVGTIREWKGKKYIKVAPNQWKPKYDKINRGAKMSLTHLKKAVANCNSEEELYNLMNTNASRFRDENGYPLPEVQELHDIVSKRQAEMSNTGDSGENAGESAGNGGSAEVNGSEEKKEDKKTSYADKIAAIQKMGKKTENAIETTGSSGRADKVAENAVDDTVTAVKNAVSKNENKAKKDKKQVEMNGIPDVEMTDEEKENFLKQFEEEPENDVESEGMENVSKEDKIKAVAEELARNNGSVEDWKEQLSQMPDSFIEEKFGEISGGNANNSGNSGSTKDEEGLSNQAEDEQDKRIGGSALWDQHVRNAIKTGDVDKIKTAIAQVENEYNELSKKAKYQDEKEFLMYELKYRKRDAENAINKLQKK